MSHQETEYFEVFPWNKNFETGIDLIDQQHKELVRLLNSLAGHLANRASDFTLGKIFNELTAYVDHHFTSEESIWEAHFAHDPWLESHQYTHQSFVERIVSFRQAENSQPLDEIVGEILLFLTHWLAYHILDTDKRMAKVVLALQAGDSMAEAKQRSDVEMSGAMQVLIETVLGMYDSLSLRTMELLREKTARQRAEEALKASEERWKFVLEGAGEGVWDWNIASGEVYRSEGCQVLLGFPLGNNLSVDQEVNIHADDLMRVQNDFQAHLDGQTESFTNEHRIVHQNGEWSWVLTRGKVTSRDANGKALRMIGTHHDITERELASMVINNSGEGMILTDASNTIISVNPAFTKITGYAKNEAIGKTPKILSSGLHALDFYQAMWQEILATGQWQGEIWNRRQNGEVYPEWMTINSICNPDGTVHRRVSLFSDITSQKQSEELIWRQANFDRVTGLANRHMLKDRTWFEIKKAERTGQLMALLHINIDRFREVNEAFGHATGDLLLREVAQRLSRCIRAKDTLAHLGGDEFSIILPELDEQCSIERIARDILLRMAEPFALHSEMVYMSACIGIALYPEDGLTAEAMIKNAGQAGTAAKSLGRSRFSYFARYMEMAAQIRIRMAKDLRLALQENQFIIHYQPIVDLATGRIKKAEALLRWQHPEHGMIPPATFIPLAEETGTIIEIGNWVFQEAVRQVAHWRAVHQADFQISVNKSPVQFHAEADQQSYLAWCDFLKAQNLPGDCLIIEITEGLMMDNSSGITEQLNAFHAQGIQWSLDDFGTGYSSLSYLHKFAIDYVKIDRSFVNDLTPDSSNLDLCEAIIVMAHKLGMKVVAEGIETIEQRDLLLNAGCDYAQGYLFSKPVPADCFEKLLENPAGFSIQETQQQFA